MSYGEPLDTILNFLSSTFALPAEWFGFPQIIFFFIIPLAALIVLWIFIFRKMGIFQSSTVNGVLGIVVACVSTLLIKALTPPLMVAFSVGGAMALSGEMTTWRVVTALILAFVTFYIYLWLMGTLV